MSIGINFRSRTLLFFILLAFLFFSFRLSSADDSNKLLSDELKDLKDVISRSPDGINSMALSDLVVYHYNYLFCDPKGRYRVLFKNFIVKNSGTFFGAMLFNFLLGMFSGILNEYSLFRTYSASFGGRRSNLIHVLIGFFTYSMALFLHFLAMLSAMCFDVVQILCISFGYGLGWLLYRFLSTTFPRVFGHVSSSGCACGGSGGMSSSYAK